MSNETVVIQQSNLFLNIAGRRMTALPATGTIAIMERLGPEATFMAGLHKTSLHIIAGGDGYRFTVNVMPNSGDDAWIFAAVKGIRQFGKLIAVSLTYETTKFVSGSTSIEALPVRNFNADAVEPVAWQFQGTFEVAQLGKWLNPGILSEDEITSLMAG